MEIDAKCKCVYQIGCETNCLIDFGAFIVRLFVLSAALDSFLSTQSPRYSVIVTTFLFPESRFS